MSTSLISRSSSNRSPLFQARRRERTSQRGVALLTAILVVAIAAVLMAALVQSSERSQAHTRNLARAAQADNYTKGLHAWAAVILERDLAQSLTDSRADIWAQTAPPFQLPHGQLMVTMRDLNGCFDLNSLLSPTGAKNDLAMTRLQRLLSVLQLDQSLANVILDWIDADSDTSADGAEDMQYLLLDPPHRAANRRMVDVSELRLMRGIDAKVYARLVPEVCALPQRSKLNVNTMSPAMLQALGPTMSAPVAEEIWREGRANFADMGAFTSALNRLQVGLDDIADLGVQSDYFEATAQLMIDDIEFQQHFLLHRDNQNQGVVRTLAHWR